jgi:5-methylcytosine-specific restriction endonuclease McrA
MPAKLPHTEPSRRSKKKVENFQRNQRATSTVGNPTVKAPAMLDTVASTEHPTTRSAINGESILCYINDVAACTRCHRAANSWAGPNLFARHLR